MCWANSKPWIWVWVVVELVSLPAFPHPYFPTWLPFYPGEGLDQLSCCLLPKPLKTALQHPLVRKWTSSMVHTHIIGASSPAHTSSGTLLLHARPQDLLSYSAQVRDRTCSPKCIRWQGVWLSIPCPRHCGWLSRTKPMRCRAMSPKFTAPSSWQGARSALLCLWHQGLPSHTAQVKGGASSPTPSSKSAVLCLSTRVSCPLSSRWRMWPTLLSLHHCYFREAEPALLYAQYWGQKPRAHSTRVSSLVLSQWGAGTVLEYA